MGDDALRLDGRTIGDIVKDETGPLYVKLEQVTLFDFGKGTTRHEPAMRLGVYAETAGGRPKPPRMFTPELLAVEGEGFPWLLRALADELERAGVTGRDES